MTRLRRLRLDLDLRRGFHQVELAVHLPSQVVHYIEITSQIYNCESWVLLRQPQNRITTLLKMIVCNLVSGVNVNKGCLCLEMYCVWSYCK